MFRDLAIALLLDRLNRVDLTSRAQNEIMFAQDELENPEFTPWFLYKESTTLVTVAQNEAVAVPTDFIAETTEDDASLFIVNATTSPSGLAIVSKGVFGNLAQKYKDSTFGQPLEYALVGLNLKFRPIPDAVYTLQWGYFGTADPLTTNIENVWLKYAPDLLIARTGMLMTKYPVDAVRYKMFSDDYAKAMTSLMHQDVARREAGMDRFMGDADA